MFEFGLVVVWLALAGSATLWGLDYYLLPMAERAYSPLAEQFAPTGFVGHGLGILGAGMVTLGVLGYGIRKRAAFLAGAGTLKRWLQVHIFLCTLGPYFVLLHTTFKFGGIVAISFWSMTVVVVSGIFGRYVYARIPKSLNGRFLDLEAVEVRAEELARGILDLPGGPGAELAALMAGPELAPRSIGLGQAMFLAVKGDLEARGRQRRIGALLRARDVPRPLRTSVQALVAEQGRLRNQMLLLQPFQRLFRYWHVVHLPLAVVMFVILGVHVTVAVMFGYTWVF